MHDAVIAAEREPVCAGAAGRDGRRAEGEGSYYVIPATYTGIEDDGALARNWRPGRRELLRIVDVYDPRSSNGS